MKKSQILAALALAFALGVVAPVANTVVSAETYAADTRALRTASKQEVLNAVAKVENYGPYKNFAAVIEAAKDYTTDKVITSAGAADTTISTIMDIANLTSDIADAVKDVTGAATAPTYADLETAIATAKVTVNATTYNAYKSLYELVKKDNSQTDRTALINAMNNIAAGYKADQKSVAAIKADIASDDDTVWARATEYTKYAAMVAAVKNAEAYNNFVDRMEVALNNVQEWEETDGKTAVDTAAEDATDPANALVALATDTNIKGYNSYKDLYNYINNTVKPTSNESADNQNFIDQIDAKLKSTTAIVPGDEVSLDDLKTPSGTGEGENKPGDDNKDPNAPDTGILADGEANASTTVAMVAGIATALTAAGAGVVAYRNARRSTRK